MKYAFLALLAEGPAHGYELKQALEQRFGSTLAPLNAGQVYTTLQRLERDGLVEGADVPEDTRQKRVYELTPAGRDTLAAWVGEPVPAARPRDEFFLKLVLAGLSGIAEPMVLIARQRQEVLRALRDVTDPGDGSTVVRELLAEGTALHLEADLKWLDLCQERLFGEVEHGNGAQG
jgi:DNA-binding PadR family transcriptional regulator